MSHRSSSHTDNSTSESRRTPNYFTYPYPAWDPEKDSSIDSESEIKASNGQVKDNKIDLLVQQYEQFTILKEESIDSGFARFNTIITSLKALDEGSDEEEYAMAVRNFKKFFQRKGKFVRQPREEKKSFRQRDEKKGKSDRKCFRCGDPNHLIGDCLKPTRNKDQKAFIGGS
ncbi:zf-CCHC domain-containing protein [Tanacetum coccineum]